MWPPSEAAGGDAAGDLRPRRGLSWARNARRRRHEHSSAVRRDRRRPAVGRDRAGADHPDRPAGRRIAGPRGRILRRRRPVRTPARRGHRRGGPGRPPSSRHRQSRPRPPQRPGPGRVPRHRRDLPARRHDPVEPGPLPHRPEPGRGRRGRARPPRARVRARPRGLAGRHRADRHEHRGRAARRHPGRRLPHRRRGPRGDDLRRRRVAVPLPPDLSDRLARAVGRDALGPGHPDRPAAGAPGPRVDVGERHRDRGRAARRVRRRRHLRVHLPGEAPHRAGTRVRGDARRHLVPALRGGGCRRQSEPARGGRAAPHRDLDRHLPERAHAARLPVPGLQRGRRGPHRLRRHPSQHRRLAEDLHQLPVRPARGAGRSSTRTTSIPATSSRSPTPP